MVNRYFFLLAVAFLVLGPRIARIFVLQKLRADERRYISVLNVKEKSGQVFHMIFHLYPGQWEQDL